MKIDKFSAHMENIVLFLVVFPTCNILYVYGCLENRLCEIYPVDYDKFEPPWKKDKPVDVYIKLNIMDIDQIYDGAMEFSIQSYLVEYWKDYRLNLSKYTESHYHSNFPEHLVKRTWVPDLVFDNTKDGKLFQLSVPNTVIKVLKDGTLLRNSRYLGCYRYRYNFLVNCQMDFKLYPMDTQKCFLKIATLSNPDFKVLLHWAEDYPSAEIKSIELMNDIEPLMYFLLEPVTYKSMEMWTTGKYTYLYANFTFVRRISGSIFNVYVPSALVVFLSWISFWLDIEAIPARITLGVTSLLTLSTQVAQAHSHLPSISYLTAMDVWLFACLIMVFSSLLEFALAYQLFINEKQKILFQQLSGLKRRESSSSKTENSILRKRSSNYISSNFSSQRSKIPSTTVKWPSTIAINQKCLDRSCRILFPSIFFTIAVVYWSYYLHYH